MKQIILFTLFFASFAAHAFNGSFSGPGKAVFASGKTYECTEIYLRLETSQDFFRLRDGGYKCGGLLQASFDPYKMSIRNGKLFDQNNELGTISDQEIKYQIFDPEDGSTYYLTLTKNTKGEILYHEQWHDGEKIALTIKGTLK